MTNENWLAVALPLVKKWEGCKLTAYLCPARVWTIGYGATGSNIRQGTTWTAAQAEADLVARLRALGAKVDNRCHVALGANQKAALVSLAYNIGIGAFEKSTLLRMLNAGDFLGAADQFLRWNRAGGVVLQGLSNRRKEERQLFMRGR